MTHDPLQPTLSLRIRFGKDAMFGPGKAELLRRIDATGSIAAAARDMGRSYKRAWMLIETLNTMFDQPLVSAARGGPGKGGAVLTERGRAVLQHYGEVEAVARAQTARQLGQLRAWRRPGPDDGCADH